MATEYRNQPGGIVVGRDRATVGVDEGLRQYMLKVYNWMALGLVLTGATAFAVISVEPIQQLFFQYVAGTRGRVTLTILGWVALFAPLVMAFFFRVERMSVGAATGLFWIFAAVMGISLAPIVAVYTGQSLAKAFFISAATFGAMSLYGYTTKRDLTGIGNFLIMGLIGCLIAVVVNIFLQSPALSFALSILLVLIFVGLTAYDTQWIKNSYDSQDDGDVMTKKSILGALHLYLDFVNIFVLVLQLFGVRRD
jgi:FtsH-binding integral membrane protein